MLIKNMCGIAYGDVVLIAVPSANMEACSKKSIQKKGHPEKTRRYAESPALPAGLGAR
jgi:hypothetical protein